MKKLLAMLLVLAMLLTSCFALVSCNNDNNDNNDDNEQDQTDDKVISKEDIENDAQSALIQISNNTMSEFFTDDANIGKIIEEALKKGSFTLGLELGEELAGVGVKASETIYFDVANKKFVSDTSIEAMEETLFGRIFIDKNGIAVSGADILGSDKTLALNFATLAEKFGESGLIELLPPVDEATMADVTKVLELVKSIYEEKIFGEGYTKDVNDAVKAMYSALKLTVTEEDTSLVVSYTINNESIVAVYGTILDIMDKQFKDFEEIVGEGYIEDAKELLDMYDKETLAEMLNEAVDIDITEKLYVDKESSKAVKTTLTGTITPKEEGTEPVTFNAEITYSANEIKITAALNSEEMKVDASAALTKEVKDGATTYKLAVNVGDGKGATVNFLNATYTYTKATGDIVLAADIYNDGADRIQVKVNGAITTTENEVKIELTSAEAMGQTVEFLVYVTFNKAATMPTLPADAKDIVTVTAEEWQTIAQEVMTSKFAELMGFAPGALDGEYTYSLLGTVTAYYFDGDEVYLTVYMNDTLLGSYVGTYSVTEDTITFDFGDEEMSGTYTFADEGDYILIDGVKYYAEEVMY